MSALDDLQLELTNSLDKAVGNYIRKRTTFSRLGTKMALTAQYERVQNELRILRVLVAQGEAEDVKAGEA